MRGTLSVHTHIHSHTHPPTPTPTPTNTHTHPQAHTHTNSLSPSRCGVTTESRTVLLVCARVGVCLVPWAVCSRPCVCVCAHRRSLPPTHGPSVYLLPSLFSLFA